jgi:hypothetical protein
MSDQMRGACLPTSDRGCRYVSVTEDAKGREKRETLFPSASRARARLFLESALYFQNLFVWTSRRCCYCHCRYCCHCYHYCCYHCRYRCLYWEAVKRANLRSFIPSSASPITPIDLLNTSRTYSQDPHRLVQVYPLVFPPLIHPSHRHSSTDSSGSSDIVAKIIVC